MSPVVILSIVGACFVAAFPVVRIIAGRRSFVGAALSIMMGFFASMGALHAWGESKSIPWTAGYGAFVLLCVVAAIVQLMPDRDRHSRFWTRLIAALLAGFAAALAGFGIVALFFLVTEMDPGIGGGLIGLLAGFIGAVGAATLVFRGMSNG